MPVRSLRAFAVLIALSLAACGSSTASPQASSCGAVSYTFPHTHDEGHAAMNYLTALNVSCKTARAVASTFLKGQVPKQWHSTMKSVVVHRSGEIETVSEEILSRGNARVTGDIAN